MSFSFARSSIWEKTELNIQLQQAGWRGPDRLKLQQTTANTNDPTWNPISPPDHWQQGIYNKRNLQPSQGERGKMPQYWGSDKTGLEIKTTGRKSDCICQETEIINTVNLRHWGLTNSCVHKSLCMKEISVNTNKSYHTVRSLFGMLMGRIVSIKTKRFTSYLNHTVTLAFSIIKQPEVIGLSCLDYKHLKAS